MWGEGDIGFWVDFVIENSIKLQKKWFCKEKLIGSYFTLGLMAQTTLVFLKSTNGD
jgi:hypothetical protein